MWSCMFCLMITQALFTGIMKADDGSLMIASQQEGNWHSMFKLKLERKNGEGE